MNSTDMVEKFLVPLIAAFVGAILAFRYQHTLELRREKRYVLQNLMMYRSVGANELDWIKALNVVDLVFNKNKKVKVLYHKFLAYTDPSMYPTKQYIDVLYELMYEMGQCSGYKNLTLADIRDSYGPEGLNVHYPMRKVTDEPKTDLPKDKQ